MPRGRPPKPRGADASQTEGVLTDMENNNEYSGAPHKCNICLEPFAKESQYQRHMQDHERNDKPYCCDQCPMSFNNEFSLTLHKSSHNVNDVTCSVCNKKFSRVARLKSHIKIHEKEEVTNRVLYPCTHCSRVFKSIKGRRGHSKKVHGEASQGSSSTEGASQLTPAKVTGFETECLPNKTSIEYGHEQGQANHDKMDKCMIQNSIAADSVCEGNDTKHICTFCNKEFKKPSLLANHIRIHTHEKPFKCSECFRAFKLKGHLFTHMKTHSGVKPFKCNFCMKCFSTAGSLKVHIRLHTGETPFACPRCDKKFKTYGRRETHITTHLTPSELKTLREQRKLRKVCPRKPIIPVSEITLEEPILVSKLGLIHPVPRCKQFILDTLSNNYAYEVDRPFKCCYCPRAFKRSGERKVHIRYHTGEKPFKCKQCGRGFPTSGYFKIHMETHSGLKPYKCLKCNSAFSTNGYLRRHMARHNDLRPYMCPYCQKTFKTFPNCKSHLRTHRYEVACQLQQQMTTSEENSDQNKVSAPVNVEAEDNVLPLNVATQQNTMLQSALDTLSPSAGQDFTDEPKGTDK